MDSNPLTQAIAATFAMDRYSTLIYHGVQSVYTANKMRGLPNCGRDWFINTRETLRKLGFKVYCPVELDEIFPSPFKDQESQEAWRFFMQRDIELILQAKPDAILLGPQWLDSIGANIEMTLAPVINAQVFVETEHGIHLVPQRSYHAAG